MRNGVYINDTKWLTCIWVRNAWSVTSPENPVLNATELAFTERWADVNATEALFRSNFDRFDRGWSIPSLNVYRSFRYKTEYHECEITYLKGTDRVKCFNLEIFGNWDWTSSSGGQGISISEGRASDDEESNLPELTERRHVVVRGSTDTLKAQSLYLCSTFKWAGLIERVNRAHALQACQYSHA